MDKERQQPPPEPVEQQPDERRFEPLTDEQLRWLVADVKKYLEQVRQHAEQFKRKGTDPDQSDNR